MADTNTVPEKAPKSKLVDNFYENVNGERSGKPWVDTVAVGKIFHPSGFEWRQVLADIPEGQRIQLMAFGLQQVTQNAYGTAENEDERITATRARNETLLGGSWASERQIGPATSDLVEAFTIVYQEKSGRPADAERVAEFKRKLETGELTSKGVLENPFLDAAFQALKARRAQERAKIAAEKAAASGDTSFDF